MDIIVNLINGQYRPEEGFATFLKNLHIEYPKTIPNPLNSYVPDSPNDESKRLLILALLFRE